MNLNYPFGWIVERNAAADRQAATEYAAGRISKETYEYAVLQHKAEGNQTDQQARMQTQQQNLQAHRPSQRFCRCQNARLRGNKLWLPAVSASANATPRRACRKQNRRRS
jgi:hypothetical protein